MDWILLAKAAFLGIVEGLTEFLPISSTGHLILAGSLVNFTGERAATFEIAIQTGAILAVMWEFRQRIMTAVGGLTSSPVQQKFALNIFIGFLPAVVLALMFSKAIKAHLFAPVPVAIAFIVGAFIILYVERRMQQRPETVRIENVDDMSPLDALKVGLAQCAALIPGTSRSGATIIGGMWLGLSRKAATEFSFFLAMPTLIGAGVYSLYKARHILSTADIPLFAVGFVTAFISAMLCVRWLLRFISQHSFAIFAYYRIVFGVIVLVTYYTGWIKWAH